MEPASVTYADFAPPHPREWKSCPSDPLHPQAGCRPCWSVVMPNSRAGGCFSAPSALIVIQGEAGIGKSRLVRELLTEASGTSAVWSAIVSSFTTHSRWGRCSTHPASRRPHRDRGAEPGRGQPGSARAGDRRSTAGFAGAAGGSGRHGDQIFRAATELLDHVSACGLLVSRICTGRTPSPSTSSRISSRTSPRSSPSSSPVARTSERTPVGEAFARAPAADSERSARAARRRGSRQLPGICWASTSRMRSRQGCTRSPAVFLVIEEVLRTLLARLPAAEIPSHRTRSPRCPSPGAPGCRHAAARPPSTQQPGK